MKKIVLILWSLLLGNVLYGQSFFDVANGENAPPLGTIIPEEVTFAMSPTPVNDFQGSIGGAFFSDLELRSYADFPNEVVVTLYFTPW